MGLIEMPGLLRFRAGDKLTPELIGRRLTQIARLKEGAAVSQPVLLRAGDPTVDTESILAQRRPLDLTISLQQLLAETEKFQNALTLQAELNSLSWAVYQDGRRSIMRSEVPVNLFRLALTGYDFGFTGPRLLIDQISSPQEWAKPVRSVSIPLALEFITRLNDLTSRQFRLPTDEEYQQALLSRSGEALTLLGDLWTICTTDKVSGGFIYRMVNGNRTTDPIETYVGLRLVEQKPA